MNEKMSSKVLLTQKITWFIFGGIICSLVYHYLLLPTVQKYDNDHKKESNSRAISGFLATELAKTTENHLLTHQLIPSQTFNMPDLKISSGYIDPQGEVMLKIGNEQQLVMILPKTIILHEKPVIQWQCVSGNSKTMISTCQQEFNTPTPTFLNKSF